MVAGLRSWSLVLALFAMSAPPVAATSLPTPRIAQEPNGNCNDRNVSYSYWNSASPWSEQAKEKIDQGLAPLRNPKASDGLPLVEIEKRPDGESGSNNNIRFYIDYYMPDGKLGTAECTPTFATVRINGDYEDSNAFMWQVGAHELMHLMGGNHSSAWGNNPDLRVPRLATCTSIAQFPYATKLSRDDRQTLSYVHDPIDRRQLTFNSGFENDFADWKVYPSSSNASYSITDFEPLYGNFGAKFVKFGASTTGAGIQFNQMTSVLNGDDDETYYPRISARRGRADAGFSVTVRLSLYSQFIGITDVEECEGDDYADGLVSDNIDAQGAWVLRRSGSATPGQDWATYTLPSYNPYTSDAYIFEIIGHVDSPGASDGNVLVDGLRLDGT